MNSLKGTNYNIVSIETTKLPFGATQSVRFSQYT